MLIKRIYPIQPYFVLNTETYHKLFSKAPQIAHFYQFTYTEDNPVINGAVPDGAIDIIFDIDGCSAYVSGSAINVTETMFEHGHTYFGARFELGVFEHFGNLKASELIGTSVPLTEALHFNEMERIFSDISLEERAEIIRCNFPEAHDTPSLVTDILKIIYEQNGNVTVNQLEQELFYSRRHLTRLFRQYIGMDIKSYCRIARFQSVLHDLSTNNGVLLTDIAHDHGYYDQTHFQKEFKQFSLLTPKVYVNIMKNNSYRSRIKTY